MYNNKSEVTATQLTITEKKKEEDCQNVKQQNWKLKNNKSKKNKNTNQQTAHWNWNITLNDNGLRHAAETKKQRDYCQYVMYKRNMSLFNNSTEAFIHV